MKFEIGKMLFPTLVVIWSQLVKSGATSGQQQCQSFSTDNFYCKNVNYNQTFFPHRILESERIRTQVNRDLNLGLVTRLHNRPIYIPYVIHF